MAEIETVNDSPEPYHFVDADQYPDRSTETGTEPEAQEATPSPAAPSEDWKPPSREEWNALHREATWARHNVGPMRRELRELHQWRDEVNREKQEEALAIQAIEEDEQEQSLAGLAEEDRIAWLARHQEIQAQRLQRSVDGLQTQLTERERLEQDADAQGRVSSYLASDNARFRQVYPDYPEAVQWFVAQQSERLRAARPDLSDQEIVEVIQRGYWNTVGQAITAGVSPANLVYHYILRAGYTASIAEPAEPTAAPKGNGNGLARKRQAIAGAASTGSISGRSTSKEGLGTKNPSELSDEEYAELRKRTPKLEDLHLQLLAG